MPTLLQGDLNGVLFSQPKNHASTDGYHCAGRLNDLFVHSESAGGDVIKSRSCRQVIKTPAIYLDAFKLKLSNDLSQECSLLGVWLDQNYVQSRDQEFERNTRKASARANVGEPTFSVSDYP